MAKSRRRYIIEDGVLMEEWDTELNCNIDANQLVRSSKVKVNWKCKVCGYKWQTAVYNRTYNHTGCPKCANSILIVGENDLATTHPLLANEWHPTKNGDLLPTEVRTSAHKKVWWKCSKCDYEWEATINNRSNKNSGCPSCTTSSGCVKGKTDLKTTHCEIVEEWHPIKNGNLSPDELKGGSSKKVWWICKSCGYEWKASVYSRIKGSGCPKCFHTIGTSFPEQAIYYYVKQLYPDAISGFKSQFLGKMELDIYIPSIKLGIEYDGKNWHKEEKVVQEQKKYSLCHQEGIKLIRIREKMAKMGCDIADVQMQLVEVDGEVSLEETIKEILRKIDFTMRKNVVVNLDCDEVKIREMYQREIKTSLVNLFPDVSREWHPIKNGNLEPKNFHYGSEFKAWWKCSKCNYEWQSTIKHRTRKRANGCPACSNQKLVVGRNDLATTHPDLAKEWHPTKNGELTAQDVVSGGNKKYWWQCVKCGYEWSATIVHRKFSKSGCPLCANKVLVPGVNDLATKFPIVAKEWDYEKNYPLTPSEIHSGSNKKVWWKCSACGKSWERSVIRRTIYNTDGCRNCNSTNERKNKKWKRDS